MNPVIVRAQANPEITLNLLAACKAARPHFTNPKSLVGHQLQAAIDMADVDHVPLRPLAAFLEREAATVGAGLDSESLEQGDAA